MCFIKRFSLFAQRLCARGKWCCKRTDRVVFTPVSGKKGVSTCKDQHWYQNEREKASALCEANCSSMDELHGDLESSCSETD